MTKTSHYPLFRTVILICLVLAHAGANPANAQRQDTTGRKLEDVIITDRRKPDGFKSNLPSQTLGKAILKSIHTNSVADAARLFSGALVKDYGGLGGLKTISVRGLGASSTGILYDGLPVSDLQTGQIDLGRYSSAFIRQISLFHGNPERLLLPARAFAGSSVLSIETNTFQPVNRTNREWYAGLGAGSFGLWQPAASMYLPLNRQSVFSADLQAQYAKGNYPYQIENGNQSQKARRTNAGSESEQAELNFYHAFRDSGQLQTKLAYRNGRRHLPGAVIFYNPRSAQKLFNEDLMLQIRYSKPFQGRTAILFSGKFANTSTRYRDPDFLNGQGGLDNRYRQQEGYLSAAATQQVSSKLTLGLASDVSYSTLRTNTKNFVFPSRLGLWNNLSMQYANRYFDLKAGVLSTYISDRFRASDRQVVKDRINPVISIAYRIDSLSPFLLRAFYKESFRMPTFNDLYYNFIGNRDLKPEQSTQYNLGVSFAQTRGGAFRTLKISVDVYVNEIYDKIIAVPGQNLFNWSMYNLGRVKISGIDLNTAFDIQPAKNFFWFSRVAFTWQRALNVTDPNAADYRNQIPYTPGISGSVLNLFKYRQWSLSHSLLFSGRRYALGANDPSNRLDAWATQDLGLTRMVDIGGIEATLKAAVINVTNAQYDIIRYFPMPGRHFMITLSFNNR